MAFIRNTDKFVEGLGNKFFTDGRAQLALQETVTSLEGEDSGMKIRLDVIEGGAGVSGSIAKAQADAQSYTDQQIAALVNSAPEVLDTLKELSDAIGGDASFASTVAGQIGAVDAKVEQEILDRQAAISGLESSVGADVSALESADAALSLRLDELELDPVTKSYVDSQDSSESSARQSADSALSGRLDVIEGNGEGSVAKAEQDAKEYADGLDSAMDARMLVLEADPTTKAYVDGEISDLQGQITQEISDRQADVEAEEERAMAAEGLLSGRLDTLELDPVTKTYVDGEVSGLQGQITQEISDRQSGDSGLQSQIDTEKGRIDAILLSADADKDSFAEIVQLINSVDTENDSAFASYVLSNDAALAQEVSDRQSGDSALSGRLDVLESDPVTKTYVDGLDSAMDSRMDVLEAAEPGLMKVDGTRAMTGDLSLPSNGTIKFGGGFPGVVFSGTNVQTSQTQIKQQKFASRLFTSSGTLSYADDIAICTVSSAPIVVNLPTVAQMLGRMIKVKAIGNNSTNYVRIQAISGQVIDGQPNFDLEVDGEAVMLFCHNYQWYVM
jgi:hypothetical protein